MSASGVPFKQNGEMRLLLSCARPGPVEHQAACIRACLQDAVDWSLLCHLAQHHHVVPLLSRGLQTAAPQAVPAAVRRWLDEQMHVSIQSSLHLTRELLQLLARFRQRNIQVLPYKGPVLATSLYGDLSLRPFGDLDLLVRDQDVLQALDVLLAAGYQILRPAAVATGERPLQMKRVCHLVSRSSWAYQLVLWQPARQVLVELHWRPLPRYVFPASPQFLWEDLDAVSLGNEVLLTFSPENLLWFLCVHGAKHRWQRLSWICDLAHLLEARPDLDWSKLMARARALGTQRRLCLGIFLAHSLFQVPLPRPVEHQMGSRADLGSLARPVMAGLLDGAGQDEELLDPAAVAFQVRVMERLADRGRYLLHLARKVAPGAVADWARTVRHASL
ncbi:MAG: hypothetical protein KatS3mg050_1108 [Litorilinea sp.]|nr:MAG: hypothetical protein KatS3mg050_1108 [Litorilinea sp.]